MQQRCLSPKQKETIKENLPVCSKFNCSFLFRTYAYRYIKTYVYVFTDTLITLTRTYNIPICELIQCNHIVYTNHTHTK